MDRLSKERRSWLMGRVGGKDTAPEMKVRHLLHGLGYRYRLHVKGMAGRPDLVFPSRHKVIFVHGCFWHGHTCRLGRRPKSNVEFWESKAKGNISRDAKNVAQLTREGWDVLVIWQCEVTAADLLERRLVSFLGKRGR